MLVETPGEAGGSGAGRMTADCLMGCMIQTCLHFDATCNVIVRITSL